MVYQKGQPRPEPVFTLLEREKIWEWYFGKKYSLSHIAHEYGVFPSRIAQILDIESERRWRVNHPHLKNRVNI